MNLKNIKRPYDTVIGLGSACDPTIHIKRHNLRKYSLPLDWVVSLSLSDVNRLLKNKFIDYMKLENLRLKNETHFYVDDGIPIFTKDEPAKPIKSYFIEDTLYNILSVHDFPILQNQNWAATYPTFKEKLNKRVLRFLDLMNTNQSILFVRWSATYEQAIELSSVLNTLTNALFHIVILNPVEGLQNIIDMNWKLDKICGVKVPNHIHDFKIWDYILNGVTLTK
ncbi:peptidase [Bacillus thuringiensis]|uniref:Peptidase n=1 Tax=Bacillus thuringiensis TaxID=1428 RepID=A0A9X7G2A4_BACTU|nr:DUF1796 family putative cysteine peptidase [Bacillus thuringiensis]PFT95220.1 peptidase [Bacillus thuringiensis]HEQ3529246.1 peptidase [Bacillus cereus]